MNRVLWEQLKELIANHIGFQIRSQDTQDLSQKITARIKDLNLSSLQEYYDLLVKNTTDEYLTSPQKYVAQKEWKILANSITNGESFFFRDRGQFDLLSNTILPKIITSKRQAKEKGKIPCLSLKVWSAGCSTGEEVYSLAMLISELIPDPAQWQIVIIGTDINQNFLKLAREGIYKQWSFRLTDPHFKAKYFVANGQNWQVKPYIKSMVSFYQDNLIDINNISHYNYALDLVLCRNVFIYFDTNSIIKSVKKIASTLSYGGYFISGHAELQAIALDNFKLLSFPESIVYQYLADRQEAKPLSTTYNLNPNHNLPQLNQDDSDDWQKSSKLSLSQNLIPLSTNSQQSTRLNSSQSQLDYPETKLKEIQKLLENKDYQNVIQEAQQLIQQQPKRKEPYYLIAQAYTNQGNLEQAQKNCDRSLQIDSIYIKALFLSAQIAEEQNNYHQAKEALEKIITIDPLSVNAYLDLGKIYRRECDFNQSQKMYQAASSILQNSSYKENINYRI